MTNTDLSGLRIDKSSVSAGRPGRRKYYLAVVIIAAAIVAILFFSGLLTPAVEVEVATVSQVYPTQAFTLQNASGYVVAERKAAVASKITSRLVEITVEEGSKVRKGEVIARLEGDDTAAARDQAMANLDVARTQLALAKAELQDATLSYQRSRELIARELIARAEFDSAEARYLKAEASVKSAEASIAAAEAALKASRIALDYTLIRAPFDAVVLTKNADVGDIITPLGAAANAKAAVVNIADMNSLQVHVDVSEASLHHVHKGQPCEIQLDALPGTRFRGRVHMIVPTADRTKASVLVKVSFDDKDQRVLPDMSAKVAFLSRDPSKDDLIPRTAINPAAVLKKNNSTYLYVLRDDRAVMTSVTLGGPLGDMVEAAQGVKPGERIIVRPLQKVRDGAKVKVPEK